MTLLAQFGWIFWFILVAGGIQVILFFERMLFLQRARIDYSDFLNGVFNVLDKGDGEAVTQEALMLCEATDAPAATVARIAIEHRKATRDALREAVQNTKNDEIAKMERRIAAIAVTCQVAPLLGLFGTVLSVVRIVLALNEHAPLVQSVDLTSGLLQALCVTAAGLAVAILCHLMYTILSVRIDRIVNEMNAAASEITAHLTKETQPAS